MGERQGGVSRIGTLAAQGRLDDSENLTVTSPTVNLNKDHK